jgi:hypothetical protein
VAQEVQFGDGGAGKVRSFAVGIGLAVITIGFYYWFWYYFVNDELKDIGVSRDDPKLGQSSPGLSVTAVVLGGLVIIPPLLSVYNYGQRIKRAQRLVGVSPADQINPVAAFLLYFPGGLLIIPVLFHYWYVTNHQNRAVRAAGGLDPLNG